MAAPPTPERVPFDAWVQAGTAASAFLLVFGERKSDKGDPPEAEHP